MTVFDPLRTFGQSLKLPIMNRDTPNAVTTLVSLAQKFQRENGGFLPFGEVCERDERKYQAMDDDDAREAISKLNRVYREKAAQGLLEWAALCTDVRVSDGEAYPDGTDAIQVAYEDRDGQSANYYVPYRERANGSTEYHPLFARDKERCWFA